MIRFLHIAKAWPAEVATDGRRSHATPWLLTTLLVWASAALTPAHADTLYVGRPQPWLRKQDTFVPGQSFETPSQALAAASDGDRIILLLDVAESFNIDKRVAVLGYGNKARPLVHQPVTVTASGVEIDNLHFRTLDGPALTLASANDVAITRSLFTECKDAITLNDSSRCQVLENRMVFSGAIRVFGGGQNLFRGNQIDSGSIYAVRFSGSTQNRFVENHVRRSGWVGLVLYSRSSQTEIVGNIFEGSDIGLSVQTNDNLIRDNLFFGMARGLALTRSPFGKDNSEYGDVVYVDSDTGGTDVLTRGNVIAENTFRNCRREAILLKQAQGNHLSGNSIKGQGARGIVLMDGADDNLLEGTRFGLEIGEAVAIVRSSGNTLRSLDDEQHAVRLLGAPANDIQGLQSVVAEAGAQAPLTRAPGSEQLLAFGDFHTHSLLSDGSSTPEELLGYARDVAGLDFVAMSDHGEYVGHDDGRWETLNQTVADFALPGRFVTIPGYETTFVIGWSAHFNVYFSGPNGNAYMAPHGGRTWIPNLVTPTPTRLLERLKSDTEDALVIRHHYFSTPDYWYESPPDSDILPMTELCSVHAIWSGERDVDAYASDRSAEIRGHVSTLNGALKSGRVLGVGGSSDSHYTFPGDSGLTAVLTDALDAPSIFEALRKRRTYATTGARIRLGFTLNGEPMGSTITDEGIPTGLALVEGTAELDEVTIYENDRVLLRVDPEGSTASIPFAASERPEDGTWYMLRVRQADGEMAWSTPIWVRPIEPSIAPDALFEDRERMVLLAYAAVLRAWPELPTKDLDGLSPKQARLQPALAERFEEAWQRYLTTVAELEELASARGLDSAPQAAKIIDTYGLRFGPLPSPIRIRPRVHPMVDLDVVRDRLGL